ncbi:MAG: tRNA (adenosine(37)-N6)-threonylcarbamoyltransferase complex dimerization subunit type 1 TsaB [Pyrinomonadaceae bacterium]
MSRDPLILAVETATLTGSVCLCRGVQLLAAKIGNPEFSHSNTLLADINEVLQHSDASLKDVDLVAVAIGPGSFTGLRIGLATVKAFAATLNVACAGVPTLEAVAHAAGASRATVAVLPAGRGEVFAQLLSVSEDLVVTAIDDPAHISPAALLEKYARYPNLCWAGEGSSTYWPRISEHMGPRVWTLGPIADNLALSVALLSGKRSGQKDLLDPNALRAMYVRPSDAELNQKC